MDLKKSYNYYILINFVIQGILNNSDIVGAIFGQIKDLLKYKNLDLGKLTKTNQIGFFNITFVKKSGIMEGTISIPSSLNKYNTAIIAAAIETIENVGPAEAKFETIEIQDNTELKKNYLKVRTEEILNNLKIKKKKSTDVETMSENIRKIITLDSGIMYGIDFLNSDQIYLCEGRADLINLAKINVNNTFAIGGLNKNLELKIQNLLKNKIITVFVDGDKGGDVIINTLKNFINFDFIIQVERGENVENLDLEKLQKYLEKKIPKDVFFLKKNNEISRV